jgi:protein-tyrosine phosphatase
MKDYIDLHCHFVAGIDDGPQTTAPGLQMLRALRAAGFDTVIATPHMRPGLFDNLRQDLERAYSSMLRDIALAGDLPRVELSCEHYFDDTVFNRLLVGEGLPYPGGRAALLEFYDIDFPLSVQQRLADLLRRGMLPVIAHPERYRCLWGSPEKLERLVDAGAVALLDTAALVGKYGRETRRCAEKLLELGLYQAACSDAHRPADVAEVQAGMRLVEERYGPEELDQLYRTGPRDILEGRTSP